VRSRSAQGIYITRPAGGGNITPDGDPAYKQVYRGILAAGPGPYPNGLRGAAPAGPIVGGETAEFSPTGAGRKDVANPTPIEPFMWTLFGRCLVADMGYSPGEIVALTCSRGAATVRGWSTSYSPARNMFTLGEDTLPFFVGKNGASSTMTASRWSLFFRFIGTPKAGPYGRLDVKDKMLRQQPMRLWQSPPVQHAAGLNAINFAMPEGFTPYLVNGIQICTAPELGFGAGDWCVANEGDNNGASYAGYAVSFKDRNCVISPATNQYTHSFLNGANSALTPANWSWSVIFVG
jgi:hypothetical protein